MTSVSLSLWKPRQLELFQARAILASKKDFLLVAPGFCQVANPLKMEDVNTLWPIDILGGYRLRHSVILNRAVLACRASVRITARDCFPGKALHHSYPTKLYQSPCLFTYTVCFFEFSYHLAY